MISFQKIQRLALTICLTLITMTIASCQGSTQDENKTSSSEIDSSPDGELTEETKEQVKKETCEITSHAESDSVGRYITVKGTSNVTNSEGNIYSYTRAKLPGQGYWRSDRKATVNDQDDWDLEVVIGDEQTPVGTEFEVVIVVASGEPPRNVDNLPNSVKQCARVNLKRGNT